MGSEQSVRQAGVCGREGGGREGERETGCLYVCVSDKLVPYAALCLWLPASASTLPHFRCWRRHHPPTMTMKSCARPAWLSESHSS